MAKNKSSVRKDIRQAGKDLKLIMQQGLSEISENMIAQISAAMKSLTPSTRLEALNNIVPEGINAYKADVLDAMVVLSIESLAGARKEVPKAKKVRLTKTNINQLPPKLREKIITRNQLLVGRQISDLQSVIEFAYAMNEDTTDSDDTVMQDMRDSAVGFIDGTAIEAGANLTAATVINEAREAFFFDDEVLQEIEAFEFVNGDPVSPICQDLAGTVFAKDDPDLFRYTPPLHYNCKSAIFPILNGNLGSREVTKLEPSKAELNKYVQFDEHSHHDCEKISFEKSIEMIHHAGTSSQKC